MSEPVIEPVVEQHAEEAAFLWLLRDNAVRAPHYSLADLARLDDRIEAHLDGLRIAGEAGWRLARKNLEIEEPGEVFTAGILAFEGTDPSRKEEVVETALTAEDLTGALISCLGWLPFERVAGSLERLLADRRPEAREVSIGGFAAHRKDLGTRLRDLVSDQEPLVRSRALRAVGELGREDMIPELLAHLKDGDPSCEFHAAWSASLLRQPQAIPILKKIVIGGEGLARRSLQMLVRLQDVSEGRAMLDALMQQPRANRLAIIGSGELGDPYSVPQLLDQMRIPELARIAGEAFSMITGADLAYEDLEGEAPEVFRSGPTENPEDEDVALDPDLDLPWPDPERLAQWWAKNQGRFAPGTRYLLGEPITVESLYRVLRAGRQRQRAAAALELKVRQPGKSLFNVCAPGPRQRHLLASMASG